jgi:lipopolysaccharide export system protein LptA
LRNQEAERYARMAAMAAGLIVLIVAGVYLQRSFRAMRVRRASPSTVPSEVQQQSDHFSYSDVEQGRTIFTVRASHATQFKEQNRALLQDVWITVYGREGNRNDNIHTRECSYEPLSGGIRCKGEVQIDIQGLPLPAGKSDEKSAHVKTSDLTFNRETGEASTPAPVEFQFPQGQGHGVGVSYSTRDSTVRVNGGVEFNLNASGRAGGAPVKASGSSLEIRRNQHVVVLDGPATVRQGDRELLAGKISISLDENFRAQKALAVGNPVIRGTERGGKFNLAANQFQASIGPGGWIETILAEGNVIGARQTSAAADHFSAGRVALAMLLQGNLIREMTASGGVVADSVQGADARSLKTNALRVTFAKKAGPAGASRGLQAQPSVSVGKSQRAESLETLAPAAIESRAGNETTRLNARKFVAQFDASGRLDKLLGHSGVDMRRQIAGGAPQLSSAAELVATFAPDGQWDSLDESGNVRFQQGDRTAAADHTKMSRASGMITLEGSPLVSDSMSRTTAASIAINQPSGEVRASGDVVSTYLPSASGDAVNLGSGAAHISSDSVSGSTASGHVVYEGHARLWQGESVLQAARIELWRDQKKMQASGHVVAVFPQAPGSGPSFAMAAEKSSRRASSSTLWQIHAPVLTYNSAESTAHLEGGVTATSDQGSLESRILDVFFAPASAGDTKNSRSAAQPGSLATTPTGGQQLSRVLAQGDVIIRQGDRRGSGDRLEYAAADEKFVLSGGQPTLTDASSDTTTGRSLTFYVANDTILVDSQNGLRTLTKHRVEK